jgi:hypothetical protein
MTAEKKSLENSSRTALYKTVLDFEYSYMDGDKRKTITGKAGDEFIPPAGWVWDAGLFVLPDERRVKLPVEA